jgi:hypothetical protein
MPPEVSTPDTSDFFTDGDRIIDKSFIVYDLATGKILCSVVTNRLSTVEAQVAGFSDRAYVEGVANLDDSFIRDGVIEPLVKYATTGDVSAERDRRLYLGFEFEGRTYQASARHMPNISSAAIAGSLAVAAGTQPGDYRWNGPSEDFAFITADNQQVPMDAFDVMRLGQAASRFSSPIVNAARLLKDRIEAGEQILDVTLDEFWPSR